MDDLMQSDLFFFITSIAVVVFTAALVAALVYLITILRDVRYIARAARHETDLLSQDFAMLRAEIGEEGLRLKHLWSLLSKIFSRRKKIRVKH